VCDPYAIGATLISTPLVYREAFRATRLLERREEPLKRVRRVGPGRLHLRAAPRVCSFDSRGDAVCSTRHRRAARLVSSKSQTLVADGEGARRVREHLGAARRVDGFAQARRELRGQRPHQIALLLLGRGPRGHAQRERVAGLRRRPRGERLRAGPHLVDGPRRLEEPQRE